MELPWKKTEGGHGISTYRNKISKCNSIYFANSAVISRTLSYQNLKR